MSILKKGQTVRGEKSVPLESTLLKIIVKHQKWLYVYNGKIYIQCASEEMLVPMVRELCEKALINMNIVCSPAFTSAIIREVLETACYIDVSDDMSRYIVFNDGILDLLEMRLKPFISGKFFTSMIMANWDSTENQCPTFMSMLNLYTRGDKVLQSRLMEAMGLCLTNDTVKRIICFQGVTNSGKSLLVSFLMRLFNNEATVSLYPNEFAERFALSKIFGKSLCVCMDMESAPLNAKATAVLKQISGNDIIGAEFKYANGNVMFRSKARVILCSNFNIVPSSDDEAFNMRKLVIPFTHRINEGVIPCEVLMNRLEAEKDAIVKMLVQAYISLKNRGYIFSGDGDWYDSYVPVNGNVSIIENEVRKFINNKCIITGNDKDYISVFTLFNKFGQCSGNMCGYSLRNPNQFSGIVRSLYSKVGHARKRFNGSENALSCFTGIRVRDE